jgi:hypothetical protein
MLLVLAAMPELKGAFVTHDNINNSSFLFSLINEYVFPLNSNSSGIRFLNIGLLLTESLFLNKIVSDHRLMEKPGFVPAMTFLLLSALLPFRITTFFILISGLLIGLLKILIIIYKQEQPNNNLIAAGFITGILAAMNTVYWTTYLWLIIALFIMRPSSIKEWLICTMGFVLPFYFVLSWQYLTDQLDLISFFSIKAFTFTIPRYSTLIWTKIAVFITLPVLGLWAYSSQISKMVIQNRKAYLTVFILSVLILLILLLQLNVLGNELMFLLTPASFLFAPFFLSFRKEFIPNLILLVIIVLAVLR